MATLTQTFTDLELSALRETGEKLAADGWRGVQTLCINNDDNTVDIVYTFAKDGVYENYCIYGVDHEVEVPSLQDLFLNLFPFENEAHDLFGVNMVGMVLDFQGAFYDVSVNEPMTIITPEKKALREQAAKLAKIQAAKAAKEAAAKEAAAKKEASDE